MKKIFIGLVVIIGLFAVGSAFNTSDKTDDASPISDNTAITSQKSKVSKTTTQDKSLPDFPVTTPEDIARLKSKVNKDLTYDIVSSNPNQYKGQVIQWGGRVFVEPERDKDGVYLQAYNTDNDKNFITAYAKPDFQVKKDDYIIVTGTVKGEFEGENAFGAKLKAPTIVAGYIEAGTRSQAIAPADLTVPVNQPNTQNGFTVTLDRVELSANETRFFLKLKNDSKEKINFSTYDTKVTQGSKQYESTSAYNSDENLPSELLPGVEATGAIVFPAVDKSQKQVSLYLAQPHGEDYSRNWKDITFNIMLP